MPSNARGQRPASRSMMQAVELISTVVAPLALVTAILGYIGWIRTRAFYGYFGLSSSLISFSPQDYVLRSAEVSFGAILLLTLAGAVLLGLDLFLTRLLESSGRWENGARRTLVGLGVVLVLVSLGGATTAASTAVVPPIAGAVLLGLGAVVLLRFGVRSAGRVGLLPPTAVGLAMVVLALAGFWATTTYAQDLGVGAARDIDRNPRSLPVVTVYSRAPIDLPGTNVVAYRILDQDQQWNYRYTGARLLTYSNSRWFLIPEPGSPTYRPSVTILPDTDTVRVETATPR
jgi:hypothetical protein